MPPADSWSSLHDELEQWRRASRTATLWWRDDDTVAVTPALQRLLGLAADNEVEVALAVIPALVDPALDAHLCDRRPAVVVLQHGFSHDNHAPASAKRSELGDHRPATVVIDELCRGWQRLADWRCRPLPVLVPPWNRIGSAVEAALPGRTWSALSVFGARVPAHSVLPRCNTHVDPIDWPRKPAFVGEHAAVRQLVAHLSARREGRVDPDEATGLLTHHRVQDAAVWTFCGALLEFTRTHPAARWVSPRELFDHSR